MKSFKRLAGILMSLVMLIGLVPAAAFAADEPAEVTDLTADIKATVSMKGDLVVADKTVTVKDLNADAKLSIDEALYAVHEAYYTGGAAAGYASSMADWGLSLDKLWGDESGWFGYYQNDNSSWSLADEVKAGDKLVAFVYTDSHSDAYAKLTPDSFTAKDTINLTLEKFVWGESSGSYQKLAGATITALDENLKEVNADYYTVTDNGDGTYVFKSLVPGTYYLKAEEKTPIVPPLAKVVITGTATVDVTIVDKLSVVVPMDHLTVTDADKDGAITISDALYAAHESSFEGGAAAGYATAVGSWGPMITKLWGAETTAIGFYKNGAMSMGVTDVINTGDYIVAYVYKDAEGYSDAFSKFAQAPYTGKDSVTVTLEKQGYDADWNVVFSKLSGAAITAYDDSYKALDASAYTVTDNKDGTYKIDFTKPGNYFIQADEASPIVPAVAKVAITGSATITVTIADKGKVVVPAKEVVVEDFDENGALNIDDALNAAHEAFYEGGAAAGYESAYGSYGLGITKLWGDTSFAFGYYNNDASCWSLEDPINDGDYLVAFVYKDAATWSDSYARLTDAEEPGSGVVTLKLEKQVYDANYVPSFTPVSGAKLTAYDEDFKALDAGSYTVTEYEDGIYSVIFAQSGDFTVIAEHDAPIVPAVYKKSLTVNPSEKDEYVPEKQNAEDVYKATGDYLSKNLTADKAVFGSEWTVLGLVRSGREVPESYYESVEKYVKENVGEDGRIGKNASSDNARVIFALTALGKDVTNVGGVNLLAAFSDMKYVGRQGINGYFWTLLALDSHGYEPPAGGDVTREALIKAILDREIEGGGFALIGTTPDTDITAMTLTALAPYYKTDANVKAAVDRALDVLSKKQNEYGGFGSMDGSSSESCSQVLTALAALGIDPAKDSRFIKNGWTVVDALSSYGVEGGGIKHVPSGGINGLATDQGYYALASYFRTKDGKTSLYDMSDVALEGEEDDMIKKAADKDGKEVTYATKDLDEAVILTTVIADRVNNEVQSPDDIKILWQKDVTLPAGTAFPVTLTFAVPAENKDDIIYIYHYNGTEWEVVGEGSGETVSAEFKSLSPVALVAKAGSPQTADSSAAVWMILFIGSVAMLIAAAYVSRRSRKA